MEREHRVNPEVNRVWNQGLYIDHIHRLKSQQKYLSSTWYTRQRLEDQKVLQSVDTVLVLMSTNSYEASLYLATWSKDISVHCSLDHFKRQFVVALAVTLELANVTKRQLASMKLNTFFWILELSAQGWGFSQMPRRIVKRWLNINQSMNNLSYCANSKTYYLINLPLMPFLYNLFIRLPVI